MSRYRFVSAMKVEGFSIQAACEVADVTRSSYYDWLERSEAPTGADWDEAVLLNEIHLVHDHLDDTYGSPRMTAELRARGFCVNHKRVERLMAVNGLHARDARRRRVRTTISGGAPPPLPDLIGRDFSVGAPRRRSCGDITYVPTDEGWLYVASVLDLGSRRLIGLAMDGHMRSELVERALRDALGQSSGSLATMIFHHDRGSQGEFNRSSQHLEHGGADGASSRMDEGIDGPGVDEVSRPSVNPTRDRTTVLARDCQRGDERRSGVQGRRLTGSGSQVVPPSWRDGFYRSCTPVRSLPVLQRT